MSFLGEPALLDRMGADEEDAGPEVEPDEDASTSTCVTGTIRGAVDLESLRFDCLTGDCDWAITEVVAMVGERSWGTVMPCGMQFCSIRQHSFAECYEQP